MESKIRSNLLSCIPLFLIAMAIPCFAYNELLLPLGEDPKIWFQRSGSFTVLFSVWAEYNLMKISGDIELPGSSYSQQSDVAEKYGTVFSVAQYCAIALAISGTFIWGYGDFFK